MKNIINWNGEEWYSDDTMTLAFCERDVVGNIITCAETTPQNFADRVKGDASKLEEFLDQLTDSNDRSKIERAIKLCN